MQLLKMSDALNVKNRGIPLKIDGATRFVRGATKYTTCSDVIKMVLKKTGIVKEYRHFFAIYEISKYGEMAVPGKTRILKLIESWNFEPNKLVLRKTDPLGHVPVSSVTTKKLLKKKTHEQQDLQSEVIIKPDERYIPLVKVAKFAQKQKMMGQKEQLKDKKQTKESSSSGISTSESGSSIEDFVAKVDHTKLASFIEFFNARKLHAPGKQLQHSNTRCQSTTSDNSVHDQPIKPCCTCNRRTSRTMDLKGFNKHRKACSKAHHDLHPNKMHSIKTVNYGLVDGYTFSNSLNQTNERLSHHENMSSHKQSNKSRSKFQMAKHVLPLSKRNGSIGERLFSKTRRRSEISSDDDSVMLNSYRSINTDSFDSFYKCQNLSDANKEEQHDSGHDDVMYSDLETAMLEDGKFDHLYSSLTSSPSSSYHKLVDYSVTDDEACDDDDNVFAEKVQVIRVSNISRVTGPLEGALADDENSETSFGSSNTSGHESLTNGLCYSNLGFIEKDDEQFVYNTENKSGNTSMQNVNYVNNDVHNISNISNYIKSIFGKSFVPNEDEEMDSFMNSEVSSDDFSDEDLSSLAGGLENDIRL